jgi:hypothetical protein
MGLATIGDLEDCGPDVLREHIEDQLFRLPVNTETQPQNRNTVCPSARTYSEATYAYEGLYTPV